MIYAQIKNGIIVNTIVLNDDDILELFKEGFDDCIRVDDISPQPGIGWSYDPRSGFIAPIRDDS